MIMAEQYEQAIQEALVPPKEIMFGGDGSFRKIGREFFRYFTKLGGLQPDDRVLEAGCGIGRMAIPLTAYLTEDAEYQGFDVVPRGIKWCHEQITPRFPNFHFQLANVHNGHYNPDGTFKASEYKFPFEDERFDFIYLTSVFTHMLPVDLENYLSEISRVLKPGKTAFITYYLLNNVSKKAVAAGTDPHGFKHKYGQYMTNRDDRPEVATAYEESYILDLYPKYNLAIQNPIHYGKWGRDSGYTSFQDIIIARKTA